MEKDTGAITRKQQYLELVHELYEQNRDTISQEDYEKAKKDPAYFKALVKRLTDLYQRIGRDLFLEDRNYHAWERQFKRQE